MTTDNPGGWPDATRPGWPLNPNREGPHWVQLDRDDPPMVLTWFAHEGGFWGFWDCEDTVPAAEFAHRYWAYIAPVATPAEIAAQVAAAVAQEREAIAKDIDCGCDCRGAVLYAMRDGRPRDARHNCSMTSECAALNAAAIRARGTP